MKDRAEIAVNPGAASNLNARIATHVRSLRAGHDMTLDVLAAKCDVSRSMISLIERGESSPTAIVLEKIAIGATEHPRARRR